MSNTSKIWAGRTLATISKDYWDKQVDLMMEAIKISETHTSLHDATTQKTAILVFTAVTTSNPT
jgi:hypothetical protein